MGHSHFMVNLRASSGEEGYHRKNCSRVQFAEILTPKSIGIIEVSIKKKTHTLSGYNTFYKKNYDLLKHINILYAANMSTLYQM